MKARELIDTFYINKTAEDLSTQPDNQIPDEGKIKSPNQQAQKMPQFQPTLNGSSNQGDEDMENKVAYFKDDIYKSAIEKTALNAQKARTMAKEVGLIPHGDWKYGLRNLRGAKGKLLEGKELADAKKKLGSVSNNTFNKIVRTSEKKGHYPEVGVEATKGINFNNIRTKANDLDKKKLEASKNIGKIYDNYADLKSKEGIINKLKAGIYKAKNKKILWDTDRYSTPESIRESGNYYKKDKRNGKTNTIVGDIMVGNKGRIQNMGYNKNVKTVHTHPLSQKNMFIIDANKKNAHPDLERLKDAIRNPKTQSYKLVTPSAPDKMIYNSSNQQTHSIIQPQINIEGIHKSRENSRLRSIFLDRNPRKSK